MLFTFVKSPKNKAAMQERLIVKNFGPIKDVDLDLVQEYLDYKTTLNKDFHIKYSLSFKPYMAHITHKQRFKIKGLL